MARDGESDDTLMKMTIQVVIVANRVDGELGDEQSSFIEGCPDVLEERKSRNVHIAYS